MRYPDLTINHLRWFIETTVQPHSLFSFSHMTEHMYENRGAIMANAINMTREQRAAQPDRIIVFRPRGYFTATGYIGFLPDGRKLLFPTYDEYIDYVRSYEAA